MRAGVAFCSTAHIVLTPKCHPRDAIRAHHVPLALGTLVQLHKIVTFWDGDFCMMHMQVSFLIFCFSCMDTLESLSEINELCGVSTSRISSKGAWYLKGCSHQADRGPQIIYAVPSGFSIIFQFLSHHHSIGAQSAVSPQLSQLCPS